MVCIKTYIFNHISLQYLVLLSMVPRNSICFQHGHFNPRDGRRAESALAAGFIAGEARPTPEREAPSNPILALNDRWQRQIML